MKRELIKWHKGDIWERRRLRRAHVRNAHRTIRQQSRLQLKSYQGSIDVTECAVFPVEWYESGEWDESKVLWYDTFFQPLVRLPYFD